jgi:hypothetical protein
MGSITRVSGVLLGMGFVAHCDVLARMTQCKNHRAYSEGFVLNAPDDLPDGDYVAIFDGYTLPATKEHGFWFTPISRATRPAPSVR